MKQFFLTVLGVFTGLILFLVVLPIVLIIGAAATASPAATRAPVETVRLVPYGCTWLRMSEFPVVKT